MDNCRVSASFCGAVGVCFCDMMPDAACLCQGVRMNDSGVFHSNPSAKQGFCSIFETRGDREIGCGDGLRLRGGFSAQKRIISAVSL